MEIKVDLSKSGLTMEEIRQKKLEIDTALERLWSGKETFTGWVKLPLQQDKNEISSGSSANFLSLLESEALTWERRRPLTRWEKRRTRRK